MESSEIDLSEFQDENRDDVDHGDGGPGEGEAQPSGAEPESTSRNAGWLILPILVICIFLLQVIPGSGQVTILLRSQYHAENGDEATTQKGKKLVITDEYFQRVTHALVMHLRQHEESVMQEGKQLVGAFVINGLLRNDLIAYLRT